MRARRRRSASRIQRGRAVLEARLAVVEEEGRRLRGRLPAWSLWAASAAVILMLGGRGIRVLARNYWDLRKVSQEMGELQREEGDLQGRIRLIRSDDGYLEQVARRELGLMKKGEVEYRFQP